MAHKKLGYTVVMDQTAAACAPKLFGVWPAERDAAQTARELQERFPYAQLTVCALISMDESVSPRGGNRPALETERLFS